MHVLIVEDSPADAMLLWYGLEQVDGDYTSQLVRDGAEAIRVLEEIAAGNGTRPDLILLDLSLPTRTGHEVLAMIKGNERLQTIPVIVLSASQSPSDVSSAYRAGANSYLAKPGDLESAIDLVRLVQRYWFHAANLPSD